MSTNGFEQTGFEQTAEIVERSELGRYTVSGANRVIYAERIDGLVHITDHPLEGPGRSYLVDRCRESDGISSLEALVADYTHQAKLCGEVPMVAGAAANDGARVAQVKLARYRFTGGLRILYGQRVNGVVRVTDRPASGEERSYLVECGVELDGYSALQALVADYTHQATSLDEIPMAASRVRRIVEQPPAGDRCG
jgi:hypothetical protein